MEYLPIKWRFVSLLVAYSLLCTLLFWIALDHNECNTTSHGCQQKCVNDFGGYSCACLKGFKLNKDKKTCSGMI